MHTMSLQSAWKIYRWEKLSQLSKPMESRVPVNWHARFGEQHGGNTGYAVRPCADSTHADGLPAGGSWIGGRAPN